MTPLSEAKDICQGCITLTCQLPCGFMDYSCEDKCPCSFCLVKVMCEKRCEIRMEGYIQMRNIQEGRKK